MAQTIVMAPTTSAATSSEFTVTTGSKVTLYAADTIIDASLRAYLECKVGSVWVRATSEGNDVYLDKNKRDIFVIGPGVYRVVKNTTPEFIGVSVDVP